MSDRFKGVLINGLPTEGASTLFSQVRDELDAVVTHYKAVVADGKTTLAEVWSVVTLAVSSMARVVEAGGSAFAANDKKEVVLAAAGQFYDEVVVPLDLTSKLGFGPFDSRFIAPAVRGVFLSLVNGAVDAVVTLFDRTGWNDNPQPVVESHPTRSLPAGFIPY